MGHDAYAAMDQPARLRNGPSVNRQKTDYQHGFEQEAKNGRKERTIRDTRGIEF